MSMRRISFCLELAAIAALGCGLGLALLPGCDLPTEAPQQGESAQSATAARVPRAVAPSSRRPSELLRLYRAHSPPPLSSAGQVSKFLDWAGASHANEREDGRRAISAAAHNREVIEALIAEVEHAQTVDHSRALLALAVLGETKHPAAQAFFTNFVWRPLPQVGTVIEGEIIERTRAAQLQGKAVDSLAYINNESANKVIMVIIANHPSRIVRAEAINAYLWNHEDSDEARNTLSRFVRKDELIFLDRVRRVPGEPASTFNAKLERFLQKHPEVIPPAPKQRTTPPKPAEARRSFAVPPPTF